MISVKGFFCYGRGGSLAIHERFDRTPGILRILRILKNGQSPTKTSSLFRLSFFALGDTPQVPGADLCHFFFFFQSPLPTRKESYPQFRYTGETNADGPSRKSSPSFFRKSHSILDIRNPIPILIYAHKRFNIFC